MTAFYMFRTVYMTFHGESRMDPHVESHAHESPKIMTVPLMILALLSIVGGFVGIPLIEGGNQIGQFLAPSIHEGSIQHSTAQGLAYAAGGATTNGTGGHSVFGEIVLMLISLGIAIGGWMFARKMYVLEPSLPGRVASGFKGFYTLVFNKYLVDELYDAIVVRPLKRFSNWLWHSIDDSFIDWLVNYLAEIIQGASGLLRKIQSGFVQNYAMAILSGILFIFGYLVFYA
jgi:NADH-quinone oxidoreductase subunit L